MVCILIFLGCLTPAVALELALPTPNDALFEPGGAPAFYQPTVEGTTESGMFGCVRRAGRRFHEGIDIQCTQRDKRGESIDPVMAVAVGRVAFRNDRPGLSNYGRYVILEHRWDGVAVFTLYAHLRELADDLTVGQWIQAGQRLGTLGRSTNTREGIPPERAHLHLEICFMLNPHFGAWYARREPKAPPFGNFNGQNFIGLDPSRLFQATRADPNLNFAEYLADQPVAFTVLVRADRFPLAKIQSALAPRSESAVAAYEVGVTAWGMPVRVWPWSREQVTGRRLPSLLRVNESLLASGNCRALAARRARGGGWQLTPAGRDWLEVLTYVP